MSMKKVIILLLTVFVTLTSHAQISYATQKVEKLEELLAYPESVFSTETGLKLQNRANKLSVINAQNKVVSEMLVQEKNGTDYTVSQLSSAQNKVQLTIYKGQKGLLPNIDEGVKTIYVLRTDGTWQQVSEKKYREKIIAN
jgi:hypothetical protein